MPENTPNLQIPKPLGNEYFNRTNFNTILDTIDTAVKQKIDEKTVPDASTTQKGIVQLNDTTSSTSKTQAATANAIKTVNDSLNAHQADDVRHITSTERTKWNNNVPYTGAEKNVDLNRKVIKNVERIDLSDPNNDGYVYSFVENADGSLGIKSRKTIDDSVYLDIFNISKDGIVNLPNAPLVSAPMLATQALSANVDTLIKFSNQMTSGSYTIPENGVYLFSCSIYIQSWVSASAIDLKLFRNASYIQTLDRKYGNGANAIIQGSGIVSLNKGDLIKIYVNPTNDCSTSSSSSRMFIAKIY